MTVCERLDTRNTPYIICSHERLISMHIWSFKMIIRFLLVVRTIKIVISKRHLSTFTGQLHMFADDLSFFITSSILFRNQHQFNTDYTFLGQVSRASP